MSDAVRLLLKRKYGLVHVPNRHRADQWRTEVRRRIAAGEPAEEAGAAVAQRLFRYEYKPLARYAEGLSVRDILNASDS